MLQEYSTVGPGTFVIIKINKLLILLLHDIQNEHERDLTSRVVTCGASGDPNVDEAYLFVKITCTDSTSQIIDTVYAT